MNKNIGIWIQALLTGVIIILLVVNIFLPLQFLIEVLFILTLVMMAYNNYKVYKRKGFTILYLIAAILVLIGIIYG